MFFKPFKTFPLCVFFILCSQLCSGFWQFKLSFIDALWCVTAVYIIPPKDNLQMRISLTGDGVLTPQLRKFPFFPP